VRWLALSIAACTVPPPVPDPRILDADAGTFADTSTLTGVPNPLILGIMPIFHPDEMIRTFSPLASHLGTGLDTTVELRLSETYDETVDLLVDGKIDVAQLSPVSYVVAKKRNPSLRLIATNISDGSLTYSGYVIARSELRIRNVDDLRGIRFGFVDEQSASGYLYPYAFLLSERLDPRTDFKEVVMTGRHDTLLRYLASGRIEAGATFSGTLLQGERLGIDTEQIEIVAKTGRIPYDAWVVRADLHPTVIARIAASLFRLSTRDAEGRRILGPLRSINAFAPVEDRHYDDVRAVAAALERVRADVPP
jgi:phosphate/phosphite/phosphonate ABC transporter binding protein